MNSLDQDHPKLWIVDYYELLLNELDVRVETICEKIHLNEVSNASVIENELNRIRSQFVKEIKRVQERNLLNFEQKSQSFLEKINNKGENFTKNEKTETIERIKEIIFSDYCFLITNNLDVMLHSNRSTRLGLKLIICDWYLNENQVENLRKLLTNSINEILTNEVIYSNKS